MAGDIVQRLRDAAAMFDRVVAGSTVEPSLRDVAPQMGALLRDAAEAYEKLDRQERSWVHFVRLIDEELQEAIDRTLGEVIGAEPWTEHPSAPSTRR